MEEDEPREQDEGGEGEDDGGWEGDDDSTDDWGQWDHIGHDDMGSEPEPEDFALGDDTRSTRATASRENSDLAERASGFSVDAANYDPVGVCRERSFVDKLLDGIGEDSSKTGTEAQSGERASEWFGRDTINSFCSLTNNLPGYSEIGFARDFICGTKDFVENFQEMREIAVKGADKYFHCMANCQSAAEGMGGMAAAASISVGREVVDSVRNPVEKGLSLEVSLKDCWQDLKADAVGFYGGVRSGTRCEDTCDRYRVRGM